MSEYLIAHFDAQQQQQIDQSLAVLVSTPEHVQRFEGQLTQAVQSADVNNSYRALSTAAKAEFQVAAKSTRTLSPLSWLIASHASFNANIGIGLTSNALAILDNIYTNRVETPQHLPNVRRSMHMMLGYSYSLANLSLEKANLSLIASTLGIDARDERYAFVLNAAASMTRHIHPFNKESFSCTADADGQLQIRPKYRHLPPGKNDTSCPAAESKVDNKSSLYLLMQSMGNVAVSTIYPRRFSIVQE